MERNNWKYWAILSLICNALLICGIYRHRGTQPEYQETVVVRTDTVRITEPTIVHDTVREWKVRTLPIVRTDTVTEERVVTDSVMVMVPVQVVEYADSTYRACVSGYEPRLEWIEVYPKTIERTLMVPTKPKRWNFGVQAGVGLTPKGVQPYIGVGVGYRILWF